MLGFYFFHSVWNQLRRFIRTWAFLLFCGLVLVGSFLWYAARWYYHRLVAADPALPEDISELFTVSGMTVLNVTELVSGILILGILIIQILSAEKSVSRLFLQADVNLLFSSDRSPQEVLVFRVSNTVGLGVAAAVLILIRIPFLIRDYSLYGAISVLVSWCFLLVFSVLFKILIYETANRHPLFGLSLRWFIFAGIGVGGVLLYHAYRISDDLLGTLHQYLDAPWTRMIPVWGWIKGIMMYGLEGNVLMSLCLVSLSLGLAAVMAFCVLRLPVDYYEEALVPAQEAAMLEEAAGSESARLLVMGSRRRKEVSREGFGYGRGSSVFFFRVFHNRLRSSGHVLFTRTMITYSFAALAAGLYTRFFMDVAYEYVPVLALAVIVFFHTIVSPVTEDIRMHSFLTLPEPVWAKLFFSLLGGSCNCAFDVVIPLMIGVAAAGFPFLRGVLYLPVLMAVDFFASSSGVFTDVSIPSSIGISFKQVIQVLLIYAGLVFDGAVLAYGIIAGYSMAGFVLVTFLNLLFGGTFLGLTGVWLYPCSGKNVPTEGYVPDTAGARCAYTRAGIALLCMLLGIQIGQNMLTRLFPAHQVLALYLPVYGIGLPVFLLVMGWKRGERSRRRKEKQYGRKTEYAGAFQNDGHSRVIRFLALIPVCLFAVYGGNLIGFLLQGIADLIFPFSLGLRVVEGTTEHIVLQTILLIAAAPVMEEFVFRRCLIDRLSPYGEKAALVTSALLFALFHETVNQACYAFMLGLVLGYVYLKTGRLGITVVLHMLINSLSMVVLPALLTAALRASSGMNAERVQLISVIREPGVIVLLVYFTVLFVLTLLGAVLFFYGVRERDLSEDGIRGRDVISSWGMVLFFVVSAGLLLVG